MSPQSSEPRICKKCRRRLPIEAFERNRPNVWRSTCKECRKGKKSIPAEARRSYEAQHPRPQIGSDFYCRICERTITIENNRDVNLDHDHATGEIRGWICNNCNTGIGALNDDVNLLKRSIRWLEGSLRLFL